MKQFSIPQTAELTWSEQTSGIWEIHLYSVHFTDSKNGWVVGSSGFTILHTTANGGTTWSAQTSGTTLSALTSMFISYRYANTGWVVGYNGTDSSILQMEEPAWNPQTSGITPVSLQECLHFTDTDNSGWVVGYAMAKSSTLQTAVATWGAQVSGTIETSLWCSFHRPQQWLGCGKQW